MPVIRTPEVTGDYHETISLRGVTSGECEWCKKPRTHLGMIEILLDETFKVCPFCLLDLARDILSAPGHDRETDRIARAQSSINRR